MVFPDLDVEAMAEDGDFSHGRASPGASPTRVVGSFCDYALKPTLHALSRNPSNPGFIDSIGSVGSIASVASAGGLSDKESPGRSRTLPILRLQRLFASAAKADRELKLPSGMSQQTS